MTATYPALTRRFLLGSGPLKRTSDRLHVCSRVVYLCLTLAALPCAVVVATEVAGAMHAVEIHQQATHRRVEATLLETTPLGDGSASTSLTLAEWPTQGGTTRQGEVAAAPGAGAGSVVPVWVGGSGSLVEPPISDADVAVDAMAGGVLTAVGLLAVAGLGHATVVGLLDRHRSRAWERRWALWDPSQA